MRSTSSTSATSAATDGSKLQPPRRAFQQKWVQITMLLLSPFLVILLLLWGLLGFLLRLPAVGVALASIAATWTLWFLSTPAGMPLALLDWPVVFTISYAAMVLCLPQPPVNNNNNSKWLALCAWLSLSVFAILRSALYDPKNSKNSQKELLSWLTILSCLLPLWVSICALKLWLPANEKALEDVEKKIYQKYITTAHTVQMVAGLGTVHVPYCGEESERLPPRTLVLVHGYMAGNAFWAANLQTLAKYFNVYAVEWKGIGRSIRPSFRPKTDQEMDDFFVESLEDWRRVMQLDRFVLCGHSMGAMYTSWYVEKYAHHVDHLLLVSPAGVISSGKTNDDLFWVVKIAAKYYITPMSIIRFAGPFGPSLVQWGLRKRVQWVPETNIIRSGEMDFQDISMYSYHNWALKASGDIALYTHLHPGATARRRPLGDLFTPAKIQVPLTILYGGGGDWMPSEHGQKIVQRLLIEKKTHHAAFHLVPSAGHQVFMDNPRDFNRILVDAIHAHDNAIANGTF